MKADAGSIIISIISAHRFQLAGQGLETQALKALVREFDAPCG
jgi:hypothetical protein